MNGQNCVSVYNFLYYISMWFIYFEEYIDVASYTDDNTPYTTDPNIENTVSSLKSSSARFIYLVPAKQIARESRQLPFLVKYKSG